MVRGHIRIKLGDGWSARPQLCRPRRELATEKYFTRATPKTRDPRYVLSPRSPAPGAMGIMD